MDRGQFKKGQVSKKQNQNFSKLAALLLGVLVVAACGPDSSQSSSDVNIVPEDFSFSNAAPVGVGGKWTMTFEDTFDGTAVNTSKWNISTSSDPRYSSANVSVGGGYLRLKIAKDSSGVVRSGRIDTYQKWTQQYGYYEVRAQVPPTQGTRFAFWMNAYPGVDHVDGTGHDGAEMDIVESRFTADDMQSNIIWDGYGAYQKGVWMGPLAAPYLHTGFHTYGLLWTPGDLRFFYDGRPVYDYPGGVGIPWTPELLILSTETGSWNQGDITKAALPYYALVDYIRAWKPSGMLEAENLYMTATPGRDRGVYSSSTCSNSRYSAAFLTAVNDYVQYTVYVPVGGVKSISVGSIATNDSAIFQLYVDGHSVGSPVDLYSNSMTMKQFYLGQYNFTAGNHTLQLKVVGKNASSSSYRLRQDYFIIN